MISAYYDTMCKAAVELLKLCDENIAIYITRSLWWCILFSGIDEMIEYYLVKQISVRACHAVTLSSTVNIRNMAFTSQVIYQE